MKKYRSIFLTLFISLGLVLGIPSVYADDVSNVEDVDLSNVSVGDKFRVETDDDEYDIYEVTEVEKDEIYIGSIKSSNRLSIDHFEINAYEEDDDSPYTSRKFVKLKELCKQTYKENGKKLKICTATKYTSKKTGTKINIQRQYVNNIKDTEKLIKDGTVTYEELDREVYYSTDHELGTNEFKSLLYVNNGKGSTLKDDEDLNEEERGNFYYFGDIQDDEAENERFDDDGVLTGDVETLIDENNDIYISIRFLSEALGARVDWLAQEIDNDTDAVLIRFYDSESYCKEFDIEFTENNEDFEKMYQKFISVLKKGDRQDISFDLEYTYKSKDDIETGKAKWNKLFLGGDAAKNGFVRWDTNKKAIVFKQDPNQPGGVSDEDFQKICSSSNYDNNGQLTTLDDCIEIMGLIRYYGVPIPINLLREKNDTCTFDDNHFEEDENYYDDSDYDYDDEDDTYNGIIYAIGDIHIEAISDLNIIKDSYYDDSNIDYVYEPKVGIVSNIDGFKSKLGDIVEELDKDYNYKFVFNIPNEEVYNIINNNDNENTTIDNLNNLAKEYADAYEEFYDEIDSFDNIEIYMIPITPIKNDENKYTTIFWNALVGYLDKKNDIHDVIKFINIDDITFKYKSGSKNEYTTSIYNKLLDKLLYQMNLEPLE